MPSRITCLLFTTIFAFSPLGFALECSQPTTPDIPNGKTASEQEIVRAHRAVTDYVARGREFLGCLKEKEMTLPDDASEEEQQALVNRFNAMVSEMKAASGEFNQALQNYKKTHS